MNEILSLLSTEQDTPWIREDASATRVYFNELGGDGTLLLQHVIEGTYPYTGHGYVSILNIIPLANPAKIDKVTRAGGTVTVDCKTVHGISNGDTVMVYDVNPKSDPTADFFAFLAVVTVGANPSQFTYADVRPDAYGTEGNVMNIMTTDWQIGHSAGMNPIFDTDQDSSYAEEFHAPAHLFAVELHVTDGLHTVMLRLRGQHP